MAKHQDYLPHAYIRGQFVPFKEANVSIATNALQYGMAVFGGVKGYRQADGSIGIFRLADHLQRMSGSTKILRMPYDFDAKKISQVFVQLTKLNKPSGNVYYRPFVYRSDIALSPAVQGDYDFALYMLNAGDYFDKSRGLKVCVSTWARNSDNALPPRTKASGGYVNAALAMNDAATNGFDAAVMLDISGHVGEGAVMNLFMVRDGSIITPGVNADILEGITRRTVLEQAEKAGYKVVERQIDRTELYIADEVFFAGTATELSWAQSVDHVTISGKPGPVFTKLSKAFDNILHDTNDTQLTIVR